MPQEEPGVLHRLQAVLRKRKEQPSEKSYTCQLLAGGLPRLEAKLREEVQELLEAAARHGTPQDDPAHTVYEAADVMYHLLVLLTWADVDWAQVEAELARRFGTSGLEEKAARGKSAGGEPAGGKSLPGQSPPSDRAAQGESSP